MKEIKVGEILKIFNFTLTCFALLAKRDMFLERCKYFFLIFTFTNFSLYPVLTSGTRVKKVT